VGHDFLGRYTFPQQSQGTARFTSFIVIAINIAVLFFSPHYMVPNKSDTGDVVEAKVSSDRLSVFFTFAIDNVTISYVDTTSGTSDRTG
jgi:hypothetical protein